VLTLVALLTVLFDLQAPNVATIINAKITATSFFIWLLHSLFGRFRNCYMVILGNKSIQYSARLSHIQVLIMKYVYFLY
jgi:hypothetical protein